MSFPHPGQIIDPVAWRMRREDTAGVLGAHTGTGWNRHGLERRRQTAMEMPCAPLPPGLGPDHGIGRDRHASVSRRPLPAGLAAMSALAQNRQPVSADGTRSTIQGSEVNESAGTWPDRNLNSRLQMRRSPRSSHFRHVLPGRGVDLYRLGKLVDDESIRQSDVQ